MSIDKRLEGKGSLDEKQYLNKLAAEVSKMEEVNKLADSDKYKRADSDKYKRDLEQEILQLLDEKFKNERKPGESYLDFIKRQDPEELKRIGLKDGSNVVDFRKYSKSKEPEVKKLDLASQFTPGKTLASLTEAERDAVNMLLKLTLGKSND